MSAGSAIAATPIQPPPAAWLYGRNFDLVFTIGIATAALGAGVAIGQNPALFGPIFFLNLWILAFPHVVATFTRLVFDRQSFAAHRFLVLGLPPLLFIGVATLGMSQGQWLLATIYFHWQAFHYTRQSYGVAQAYARRSQNAASVNQRLSRWALYSLPLWGVLHRSAQAPPTFLGLDIWFAPVPEPFVRAVGLVTGGLILWWCVDQFRQARAGKIAISHFLYMLSHIAIFATGYLLIENIDLGWLVVNIWHNAQYILFVWYFQNKRFGDRIDPERRFLSRICQRQNALWFFATCALISTVAYNSFFYLSSLFPLHPITLAFLIGQTLNYHHYIVDGVIWRGPRRVSPAQAAPG